jgi:hypothetical protein
MKSIHSATPKEQELAAALREKCVATIEASDGDVVCGKLGLASTGLARLLWRPTWDLQTAFRVADTLGLQVIEELTAGAHAHAVA